MCGIAGVVAGTGAHPDQTVLMRMIRALAHRGPDAEGIVIWIVAATLIIGLLAGT